MDFSLSFPDYLLFFIGVFNLLLVIFIYINDINKKVNLSFSIFAIALTIWTVALFIFRNTSLEYAGLVMRLIYISGMCIAVALWYFVHRFPEYSKIGIYKNILILGSTLVIIIFLLIPGTIVEKAILLPDGSRSVILNSWGYYIFAIYFVFFYCGGLIIFWKQLRKTGSLLKKQSTFLLAGTGIAVIIGGFFNIVLPSPFFYNYQYIHFGPACNIVIVLSVAYSIAKYQFMNIKVLLTEFFVIVLSIIILLQFFFVNSLIEMIINFIVLLAIIVVGFLLIRSVINEVERREEIAQLAHSLEKANLRLTELDNQKTEFLSIASHQLRTPLSVIKGYIELIKDGDYGKVPKDVIDILGKMEESNEHLAKLVDEFLNITRIEQGRTKFCYGKYDLKKMTKSVVEELTNKAKENKLSISFRPGKGVKHEIYVDLEKIRHVMLNFIDNAVKYSNKGKILIKSENEDKGITFRVQDSGLGFDKKDEVNFFQKFYRGKNVEGINITGTGLGLYVCRKFIETHDGKIWGHSKGLGKGSEFGFWIPFKNKAKTKAKKQKK